MSRWCLIYPKAIYTKPVKCFCGYKCEITGWKGRIQQHHCPTGLDGSDLSDEVPLPKFRLASSHLASIIQMGNALMELPWSHGGFGLGRHQSRHLCPLICLESYPWGRSSGRGQGEYQIYMLGTKLHLHPIARGGWPTDTTVFEGPLPSGSDRLPVMKTPRPTLSRDCLCQCREEMQYQCWE